MTIALQAFELKKTKKEFRPEIKGLLSPFNDIHIDDDQKYNLPGTTLFFIYIDGDPASEKKVIFLN